MARPRIMQQEEVLDLALLLFWERGYDRTSIADLSDAIGLGPSSLYNAFGSKIEIFRMALDRYMETHAGFVGPLLAEAADREAAESVRDLLHQLVVLYTSRSTPAGCAMMQGCGAGGPGDSEACACALVLKKRLESGLRDLFGKRAACGDELAGPPRMLARFVVGTIRGLSQLATDGASRKDLLAVADHAAGSCLQ